MKAQLREPQEQSLHTETRPSELAGKQLGGLPRYVNVVRVEASWDELDTGVLLYMVHSLGDGEPVILTEVVRESVGNLKTIMI